LTVIANVPQSGVYFQRGSIVQLVIQLIDQATGLPINISTATSMSIFLLYPDLALERQFVAQLYTDGTDGRIVYTTQNSMSNVDLSEVGLYQMQGQVVIGGVTQPPSYNTDFYVLPNTFDTGGSQPIVSASGIVLFDTNNVRYVTGVSPAGVIGPPVAQQSGPPNALILHNWVMKDSNGVYWQITVTTAGALVTAQGGNFTQALESLTLMDVNGVSWVITISTSGVLVAT
jgi:hypothetical protein